MSSKCGRISFVPVELSDMFPLVGHYCPDDRTSGTVHRRANTRLKPSTLAFRGSATPIRRLLRQGELVDVDVALPEHVRASGQVLEVALVDLFGLHSDSLVPSRIQRLRPSVQCPCIVQLQRLDSVDRESTARCPLAHGLD